VLSSRSGAIHSLTGCNFSCKQQQEATDAAIQGARENAAIRQAQLVRGHNQRIFDSFKRPAEGVFDALLTKPQSIWPAIGNSLKTALLTAIKDVVTSRAAVMLMQLFTGTRVSLAGGGTPALSRRSRSLAHVSGRYRRKATGILDASVAAERLTATRQFSCLPVWPQYWRATPTECWPFSGKPVSSTTRAATGPRDSMAGKTRSRLRSRTKPGFPGSCG
jgi:hypothetical protein